MVETGQESFRDRWARRFTDVAGDGCADVACDGCDLPGGGCDCNLLALFALGVALAGLPRTAPDPHTALPPTWPGRLAARLVRSYQLNVSAGRARPVCNLSPSCSRYALNTLATTSPWTSLRLIRRRLRACSIEGRRRRGVADRSS